MNFYSEAAQQYKKKPSILCLITISLLFLVGSCNRIESDSKTSLLAIGHDISLEENNRKTSVATMFKSESNTHYGIDISHFQGDVLKDMHPRDSLRFVICKATQGDYFVDPDFRSNWRAIEEKKLIRGTYHFYDCAADPIKQALHFTNNVQDIKTTDIAPILDIEQGSMTPTVSGTQMEKDILVFLKTVERKLHRKPILYTDYAFAQEYLKNPEFAKYDLWLAEYSKGLKPIVPDTWSKKGFKMWQKSASYSAYSRQIDLDVFFGELKDIVK